MATVRSIINLALKDGGIIGQGQTASAEDITDAFTRLQWMMDEWSSKRWLVYELITLSLVSTGVQSYSIGPGQDFDIARRPARIEKAYFRQQVGNQAIDNPLTVIPSKEDYDNIQLKSMVAWPQFVFLQTSWPIGAVKTYPVVPSGYSVFLDLMVELPTFTSIDQEVNLPPVYTSALLYNLAVRLRPGYQMAPDPQVNALAKAGLNSVRVSASQIALLQMPAALMRGGLYNIYSDRSY